MHRYISRSMIVNKIYVHFYFGTQPRGFKTAKMNEISEWIDNNNIAFSSFDELFGLWKNREKQETEL